MLPLILFIVSIIGIVTFSVLLIVQRVSVHIIKEQILLADSSEQKEIYKRYSMRNPGKETINI